MDLRVSITLLLPNTDYRLPTTEHRIPNTEHRIPNTDHRLPTTGHGHMNSAPLIGLFFGSVNPIHVGHLIIANLMVETPDLDKVWFVVSPQNPFKHSKGLLHEFDRYDMVKAAIAD